MKSDSPGTEKQALRAAQYVRVSTEHQQYSIDNQSDAINQYADEHNMEIVRTYSDAGKSGLTLEHRPALSQLLQDVEGGCPGYCVILVYDVSRWGRFQDADESGYYEYRCRRANIAVHYCAEPFPNDGSLSATLLKTLKRAMAAEYSRELSAKVFAGQARLIELGFRQGGNAGYGLRRLLVDQHGNPKFVLQPGERKSIATDRIILVPGPADETEVVREIFRLYAIEGLSPAEIARKLNERGVAGEGNRPWSRHVVRDMVTNPKYIGANVSNRLSGKLRRRRSRNPRQMWIRRDNAFQPIVDAEVFRRAELVAADRVGFYTDEQLLEYLRKFLQKHGNLTEREISASPEMPSSEVYAMRFGGLLEAYRRIGYHPPGNFSYVERDRKLLPMRRGFVATVISELQRLGASVQQEARTKLLLVNGSFTIRVAVARCRSVNNSDRWLLRPLHSPLRPDISVFARLAPGNETILDYFYFARSAHHPTQLTIASVNCAAIDSHRFKDLTFLKDFIPLKGVS